MATQLLQPVRFSAVRVPLSGISIPPLWLALGLLGMMEIGWLLMSPLRLSADSWKVLNVILPFVAIGSWGAFRLADRPRLHMLCRGGAFMLIAWPVLRLYNHLTMSIAYPFADNWLAAADSFLRFDWLQYALMLDRHPTLIQLMDYSYTGLSTYSIGLFVILLLGRDPTRRCQELMVLFFTSALICSSVGMLFPATAAAFHYRPQSALFHNVDPWVGIYHMRHLLALRTDPQHVLDLNNLPGLVTFPSFHTAMGIIAIYCSRGTPWLFWPSLIINILMISSTPLFGSHYLIDVIAGAVVALGTILFIRRPRGAQA